ncbi:hypothetical protein BUALT_Bualt17G0037000 [Buddleja alternifolia]|uniref:Uncharacterized protein n=1 Tax=Buddleja alternifolia TaxID=168488 RepID=A0AAV6W7H6_9LAMI|nr:hypothetical protein BUALT_Bualt17G0037000 [Buddleja alternifolia]
MPEFEKHPKLHVAMFAWLAMGHVTPLIYIANGLAKRGHSVPILAPQKAVLHLGHLNLYPNHIKFHIVSVPQVEGLPPGAETASDIHVSPFNPFVLAFQAMSTQVNTLLGVLKPDIVFYDFAHWIPKRATKIGFKTVCYNIIGASFFAITIVPARHIPKDRPMTEQEILEPPTGYPSSTVVLHSNEAHTLTYLGMEWGTTTFDVMLLVFVLAVSWKVAVEVERSETGWFSKEDLCKAVKCVMDEDSEVGHMVKRNHAKWNKTFNGPELMDDYG